MDITYNTIKEVMDGLLKNERDEHEKIVVLFNSILFFYRTYIKQYNTERVSYWQREDPDCFDMFPLKLKNLLDEELEHVQQLLPIFMEDSTGERIDRTKAEIERICASESICQYEELLERKKELKDLKRKEREYRAIKAELEEVDVDLLKEEIERLERENCEKRRIMEEQEGIAEENIDLTKRIEDLYTYSSSALVEEVGRLIHEIQERIDVRTPLLTRSEEELESKMRILKGIEEKLEGIELLLQSGLEDIKITTFYREFDSQQEKIQRLERDIPRIEEDLKEAILRKEEFIKNNPWDIYEGSKK